MSGVSLKYLAVFAEGHAAASLGLNHCEELEFAAFLFGATLTNYK